MSDRTVIKISKYVLESRELKNSLELLRKILKNIIVNKLKFKIEYVEIDCDFNNEGYIIHFSSYLFTNNFSLVLPIIFLKDEFQCENNLLYALKSYVIEQFFNQ